jgi:threonine dehydrogenase-like Zn-dependent dehydrogenase
MPSADFFSTVPAIIVATASLGAFFVSAWATLRQRARCIAIVDLATKRLAFWEQFVKVALTVTATDSDEQQEVKAEAYRALKRVRSEADF